MADIALVVIAVDGLWRRVGHIPAADRLEIRLAAEEGILFALQTAGEEPPLQELRLMLRLDPVLIYGPGHRTEHNGRVLLTAASDCDQVLACLAAEFSRDPLPFAPQHILAIGGAAADLPLLRAAGVTAWVAGEEPAPLAVDLVPGPVDLGVPGTAQAVTELVRRNNRYLRPPTGRGRPRW